MSKSNDRLKEDEGKGLKVGGRGQREKEKAEMEGEMRELTYRIVLHDRVSGKSGHLERAIE